MRCPVCETLIDPLYFEDNCPECNAPLYEDFEGYDDDGCPCCDESDEAGLPPEELGEEEDDYPFLPSEEEELEDLEDEEE